MFGKKHMFNIFESVVYSQGSREFEAVPKNKNYNSVYVFDILLKYIIISKLLAWVSKISKLFLTKHCLTIGRFHTTLYDCRTVGHSSVQPLKNGHNTNQPLDSWRQHWSTIVLLDTALSNYCTVQNSPFQPLDCWT